MKTIDVLVSSQIQTAVSLPVRRNDLEPRSRLFGRRAPEIRRPLESEWQKRVLGLEVHHPKVQEMARVVQDFCRLWQANEGWNRLLVLMGNSGCGKTHCAEAVFWWARGQSAAAWMSGAWAHPPSVLKVHWPRISDGFKNGEFGVVEDLFDADLLVIDDLGAEYERTEMGRDKLCQVLSRREGRFTLITTNIFEDCWGTVFGERIEDRLMRRSKVVDLIAVPTFVQEMM